QDWQAAAGLLEARAAAEADPGERARRYHELGRLHAERKNDSAAARAAWERALDLEPGFAPALDDLADLAYRTGDLAGASTLYARLAPTASRLAPDAVMLRRSELAETQGDDARALELAQGAVRLAPSFAAHAAVARLAQKRGDVDLAIKSLRAGLDLGGTPNPEQLAARAELAELCRRAGDTLGAIYHLERVVAAEPLHAAALTALADLYTAHGNWQGAITAVRSLAALTGERERKAGLLHRLGELHLLHQGDVAAADDAFLRASDVDPGHVPTLRQLLDVYWRADDPTALIDVARQLMEVKALLDPATPRPTLGRVLVAAAVSLAIHLAARVADYLGADAAARTAAALAELVGRSGELELDTAALALGELARRGQGPTPSAIAGAAAELPPPAAIELVRAFGVAG
ncbi:MAG TPA: tetratricopeptide repeat protein, partial [Kofleriaceae bacterium]|nr:tetratricopeptide repeat protein [Kofleriaceae bacterium]